MVFAFVWVFVGGNQVYIELRENSLNGWGGFAKEFQARYQWQWKGMRVGQWRLITSMVEVQLLSL